MPFAARWNAWWLLFWLLRSHSYFVGPSCFIPWFTVGPSSRYFRHFVISSFTHSFDVLVALLGVSQSLGVVPHHRQHGFRDRMLAKLQSRPSFLLLVFCCWVSTHDLTAYGLVRAEDVLASIDFEPEIFPHDSEKGSFELEKERPELTYHLPEYREKPEQCSESADIKGPPDVQSVEHHSVYVLPALPIHGSF